MSPTSYQTAPPRVDGAVIVRRLNRYAISDRRVNLLHLGNPRLPPLCIGLVDPTSETAVVPVRIAKVGAQ